LIEQEQFVLKNTKKLIDLGKKHNIKTSNKNLERLSDVIEEKIDGTPNEIAYIKELRTVMDSLRDQANTIRRALGKKEIGYLKNYIPHIQKSNLWNELIANDATIENNFDFIIPNQANNPFAHRRVLDSMV
jgi:hypothetical protein